MEDIEEIAKRWLDLDHDMLTRNEIVELLRAQDEDELERRLRKRIAFGTAGLRAPMKAGFAYMNSLTVLQASNGLARYITELQTASSGGQPRPFSVVIGHDARHHSEKFARLAAVAFLDNGFQVLWFGRHVHTPLVPFSVNHFGADVGVMVTASHNPKNDNGYKVYSANGCQIIPPHDVGIAAAIEKVVDVENWNESRVDHDAAVTNIYQKSSEAYFDRVNTMISTSTLVAPIPSFIYTPMHGVGLPFMQRVVGMIPGWSGAMNIVAAQAEPDPEFPTVPFPNPEEKGALDLAKEEADKVGCSLILANDPDADRFAAAERLEGGQWHQFTGNQMGALLASYVLETFSGDRSKLAMLASTVSSRMLAAMAAKDGFEFHETLTGFKWLGNVGQELEVSGRQAVFAFEEAIGYMFPTIVWDKDGIAAAAVFLKACSVWRKQGLTPWTKLQALYEEYGNFEDANTYLISPSPDTTNKVFNDVRRLNNGSEPETIGDRKIERWRDLTLGYDSGTADHRPLLPIDANAQMITCELGDVVLTARGSGTEPKIKLYIEAQARSSEEAKARASKVLNDLLKEWFRPEYGLKLAGT